MKKRAIVTGGAGFIGSHLVEKLLENNWHVTVIDNYDTFYDKAIKKRNIESFAHHPDLVFLEADIRDFDSLKENLKGDYDVIIHLAAKAGVRPSIENPTLYQAVNVMGTQNLLEITKLLDIKQFVFASSSSVYGVNQNVPWSEDDFVLKPISPYASTKISGELLGHVYSELYGIRFIALRLFTVYGPRQRPDLAIHKFARKILADEAIPVFGDGSTRRDYTFVADIVSGILAAVEYDKTKYEIINLGNNRTITLSFMIETIEKVFGKKAIINRLPMQPGDVPETYANVTKAKQLLNYEPSLSFEAGIEKFKEWYGLVAQD
jgi:UDP-glucuronate 4-epimerase